MKILYKFYGVGLLSLIAVAAAISTAGVLAIEGLTYDLNRKLLATEMDRVLATIRQAHEILEESGVANVSSYIRAAQQDTIQELEKHQVKDFGHLTVVAEPDTVILHESIAPGDGYNLACLSEMFEQKKGVRECPFENENWLHFYSVFPEWNWMVIVSASTREMLAMRTAFINKVVVILLISLIIAAVVLVGLTRGMVSPIQQLAKAAMGISRGNFNATLPEVRTHDEVAELANAFSIMSKNLSRAQNDLQQKAIALTEANTSLNQEITDRIKVEKELAVLNRHLEDLVMQRTKDLAEKAGELEEANRQLKEMDELKSTLLSSVSHELRTPLTSVLGFAKLIKKDFLRYYTELEKVDPVLTQKRERIIKNLDTINHEGLRLTRIINDLLDLAKIESGRLDWNDRDTTLHDIIENAVNAMQGAFDGKKNVVLHVQLEPHLPDVHVDPDRIEQVIINLLHNALKFTSRGIVALKAGFANNGFVMIEISDSGPGIHPRDHGKIFDKFHQVVNQDTLHNKPAGTGLGLSICQQIIEHYGGRIWVSSTPGQGATFSFEIPAIASLSHN